MNCKCHNAPRVWQTDSRKRRGGYWRCVSKHKDFRARNDAYVEREKINKLKRRRRRLIRTLDIEIENLIKAHPFLKEVVDVG